MFLSIKRKHILVTPLQTKRFVALLLAISILTICCLPARANTNEPPPSTGEPQRQVAEGILPQLGVLLHVPEELRLYPPDTVSPPAVPIEYNRYFPIFGEDLINRGYKLPLPIGLSIIGVNNSQDQTISDLKIAIGKGAVPPADEELRSFPAVSLDTTSVTNSSQLKLDVWILPVLNLYASVGKVTGDANLTVNIDLADAPTICLPNPIPNRPPICSTNSFNGSFDLPIKSKVDRTTATVGLTGAYSLGSWFTALSGSYTDSYGSKASDVSSVNAAVRAGRRFFLGNGTMLTPVIGVNYLDIDLRVQGLTTLKDAFADGDDLNVRYDVLLKNRDKYSGSLGFNLGFKQGTGLMFEWSKSARSERFILSGDYRF